MKSINFDFDNLGGLSKIYAIPPSSFVRIRTDYDDNTRSLELRRRDGIIEIPLYCDDSFLFSEELLDNDAGDGYSVSIEGVIPKHSLMNSRDIEILERGSWYILSEDSNGTVRLSGDENVLMKFITKKSTGKKPGSRNGISFSVSCVQQDSSVLLTVEDISLL